MIGSYGPCVRGAINGSYTPRRTLCPSGDDWQLDTPRFSDPFSYRLTLFYATSGLVPEGR
jgi:hypothetical protein